MRHTSRHLAFALSLTALAVASTRAGAQTPDPVFPTPRFMIGYVANAPDQLLGAGAAWLPPFLDGWGLYIDYKQDASSPEGESNFMPDVTGEEAQAGPHEQRLDQNSHRSVNLALVRAFQPDLILYLGGGLTEEGVYSEFFDSSLEAGFFGHYWVKYEGAGGVRPNVMGGIFFRLARRVVTQFGAEAMPLGVTVGIHFAL